MTHKRKQELEYIQSEDKGGFFFDTLNRGEEILIGSRILKDFTHENPKALLIASYMGDKELVRRLLSIGYSIDWKSPESSLDAYMIGNTDMKNYLRKKGAKAKTDYYMDFLIKRVKKYLTANSFDHYEFNVENNLEHNLNPHQ